MHAKLLQFRSIQFSHSVMSDSLQPHGLQHTRPPCPWPTPGVYPNSCPLSRWYHPTISSSAIPFSSCLQSFPASGFFQMSQFFESGCQSIGVSASTWVLPMNIQDWFPSGWTGWISLQSKGFSRVSSNNTVQKHQFFGITIVIILEHHKPHPPKTSSLTDKRCVCPDCSTDQLLSVSFPLLGPLYFLRYNSIEIRPINNDDLQVVKW